MKKIKITIKQNELFNNIKKLINDEIDGWNINYNYDNEKEDLKNEIFKNLIYELDKKIDNKKINYDWKTNTWTFKIKDELIIAFIHYNNYNLFIEFNFILIFKKEFLKFYSEEIE